MKDQLVTHSDKIYDGTNRCTSITVHETANPNPGADAQAHADLQSDDGARQASWHAQVDDREAIRSYSDDAQCWHAGTDEGNLNSLAVEICVNEGGDYDAAFRRAAIEVVRPWRIKHKLSRADVKQHFDWTGKDCPGKMRLADRWEEFLDLTEPTPKTTKKKEMKVSNFSSPLPLGTYRTDAYDGIGTGRQHMGTDWAGPKPGDKTEVYAVADGVIEETGGPGHGAVLPGHSGRIIVIDHGILKDARGSDRIRTNYGHLSAIYVKEGQRVKAGQVIGRTGDTGNVTGVHLHFGVRENGLAYGDYFDPEGWLGRKGIKVGVTAPLVAGGKDKPAEVKPKPKPAKSKNSKSDNVAIQRALTAMGLDVGEDDGVDGGMQKAGVRAFQKHHGLVQDEYWGPVTQEVYDFNKRLQRALNSMKHSAGITDVKVDGWIGNATNRLKSDVLKRNRWTEKNLISNLKKVGAW